MQGGLRACQLLAEVQVPRSDGCSVPGPVVQLLAGADACSHWQPLFLQARANISWLPGLQLHVDREDSCTCAICCRCRSARPATIACVAADSSHRLWRSARRRRGKTSSWKTVLSSASCRLLSEPASSGE